MSAPRLITLGCRLNSFESEVMRANAAAAGLGDAVIINTCAVTGEAVRQAAQEIRRARRENPDARIIVTGCAAQLEPDRFAAMTGVDYVIGNTEKLSLKAFSDIATQDAARVAVADIIQAAVSVPPTIDRFGSRARAFVQIQNGCDHRCTFCIIPYARGRSRSVPAGDVVAQVRRLAGNGYAEVVLTGVDITSYGPDLPGSMTLGKLVRLVLKHVPELKRLRLSSIDQVEADADLMIALAEEERLLPHLHLSMQSGDDMILKRMKRRHTRSQAIDFCTKAKEIRPDIVFGADLIAGFPTESEAMFSNTLDAVEACGITYVHVFPFSPRQGTPAQRMPQLDRKLVKERAGELRRVAGERLKSYLAKQVGRETRVLLEKEGWGRTPHYADVFVSNAAAEPPGRVIGARICASEPRHLIAEAVQ